MTDFNKVKHLILPGSALSDAIASKKNPLGVAGMVAGAISKAGGSNQAESEAPLFEAAEDADESSDVVLTQTKNASISDAYGGILIMNEDETFSNVKDCHCEENEDGSLSVVNDDTGEIIRTYVAHDDETFSIVDGDGKLIGTYTNEEYNKLMSLYIIQY